MKFPIFFSQELNAHTFQTFLGKCRFCCCKCVTWRNRLEIQQ